MANVAIGEPAKPGVVVIDRCSGPRAMEVGQAVFDRLSGEPGTFRVSITPGSRLGHTAIVIDRLEGGAWCLVSKGHPVEELRHMDFRWSGFARHSY